MIINYLKVAEYCKTNWAEKCSHIMRVADEVCNNNFLFDMPWDMERTEEPAIFKDKIDWNYKPAADNEFIWQFNRHRYFIILAQAYRLSGDNKYAENFVRLITDWMSNAPHSNDPNNRLTWRPLEVGLRCEYWTKSLKIFGDAPALTSDVLGKIKSCMLEHIELLASIDDPWRRSSNWGVIQDHGLLAASLFYKDFIDKNYIDIALNRLLRQSHNQLFTDGVHWEQSCMYHSEVLFCLLDAIGNGQLYSQPIPGGIINSARKMLNVVLTWAKPNHCQPAMGDSDDTDVRDLLTMGAYLLRDGAIKFGGYDKLDFETAWLFGEEGIRTYSEIKPVAPPCASVALSDSGNYFMRTDYTEKANYLHFYNGYTGGGHGHADKLHFDLCINGDDILVDSGRYTYVGNAIRRKLKSCFAHNTTTVDNRQFLPSAPTGWDFMSYAPSCQNSMIITDKYELVRGGHLGYMKMLFSAYVNRRILWIKPNIYIVLDDFTAKTPHSYQQHFTFSQKGKLSLNGNKATFKTDNATTDFVFLTPNAKISAIDTQISPNYNKLVDTKRIKTNFKTKHAITVIVGGETIPSDFKAELLPLTDAKEHNISRDKGEAVKITLGGKTYTVGIVHKEMFQWLSTPSGQGFRGQLVVFENENSFADIITW